MLPDQQQDLINITYGYIKPSSNVQHRDNLPSNRCNGSDLCAAADICEPTAAFVSFQRHQPKEPRCKILDSAPCSLTSACRFSGKYAKYAIKLRITYFVLDW
jgi:hypothetical protein